uniref:Uncharacterized protein n=1 Tax=Cannabis sativa TaxID=3483 RepID=A0A803PEX3_CANSA
MMVLTRNRTHQPHLPKDLVGPDREEVPSRIDVEEQDETKRSQDSRDIDRHAKGDGSRRHSRASKCGTSWTRQDERRISAAIEESEAQESRTKPYLIPFRKSPNGKPYSHFEKEIKRLKIHINFALIFLKDPHKVCSNLRKEKGPQRDRFPKGKTSPQDRGD